MLRQLVLNNTVEIENANYSYDPDGVLELTIQEKFHGKLMSNYIIMSVKIDHVGMAYPVIKKSIIAMVDVSLIMQVLVVPKYCILPKCTYVAFQESESGNSDQSYYEFELQNEKIPKDVIGRIQIIVPNDGLTSDEIRKLENMTTGDVIPLFVIHSVGYIEGGQIGCFARPNFNDQYTPVFVFSAKMVESKKFDKYGTIIADHKYVITNGKLTETKSTTIHSNVIDFMNIEELEEYLTLLSTDQRIPVDGTLRG
jgi:hypothetical protein